MSTSDIRRVLRGARASREVVRIRRRRAFNDGRVDARVEGLSRDLVALAVVGDGIPRNGTLMTIAPGGTWDRDDPAVVAWRDVTRIDFGGDYEEALVLAGGCAPRASRSAPVLR